jgi:hypothetical protein
MNPNVCCRRDAGKISQSGTLATAPVLSGTAEGREGDSA